MNDVDLDRTLKACMQDCNSYRVTLHQVFDGLNELKIPDEDNYLIDVLLHTIQYTLKNTSRPVDTYNFDDEEVPF